MNRNKENKQEFYINACREAAETMNRISPGSGDAAISDIKARNPNSGPAGMWTWMNLYRNKALAEFGKQTLEAKGATVTPPIATAAALTPAAAPAASKPAPATPAYVSTRPTTQAPNVQTVNLKAIRGLATEMFGSLVPAETGDAKADAEALRGLFSQFNLSVPGLVNSTAATGGFKAILADRRQARIDSWHAAVTAAEPGILEQAARITNPIERTAFIRSNEQSIRIAIAASEHDTVNASKPPQHTTAENPLLAQYRAITDPAERTKFITKNETEIASLLNSIK